MSDIHIPADNITEHENCTNNKHIEMIRKEESAGREVQKVGLSISAFAEANAAARGSHVVTRDDTERARAFCYQQANITQRNVRKSNARSFSFGWGKGKYL